MSIIGIHQGFKAKNSNSVKVNRGKLFNKELIENFEAVATKMKAQLPPIKSEESWIQKDEADFGKNTICSITNSKDMSLRKHKYQVAIHCQ